MATQTESNDVSLDAKSCLSVHYFTCLLSTNANEIPSLRDTTSLRPKDVEVFSISGHGPRVSAFSPSASPFPFPFSVFGEGQGWCESRYCHHVPWKRISLMHGHCLYGETSSVVWKCAKGRRLINSTEMNDEFFQEKRKGRSFLIFVGVKNNNFSIKGWWCPRSAIIQPRIPLDQHHTYSYTRNSRQ